MSDSQYQYTQANDSSSEDAESIFKDDRSNKVLLQSTVSTKRQYLNVRVVFVICTSCILLSIVSLYIIDYLSFSTHRNQLATTSTPAQNQSTVCSDPALRQEWRTLSVQQRHEYISAVQCLQNHSSKLGPNHTLHDEFTWIHSRMGNFSMFILFRIRECHYI